MHPLHSVGERFRMSRENYAYLRFALKAARELGYPSAVTEQLRSATTEAEIRAIMRRARYEKWEVA